MQFFAFGAKCGKPATLPPSVSAASKPSSRNSDASASMPMPLDADVTLPAGGNGPFPTIVMLHGWGGNKSAFEAGSAAGDGNETFDYNNVYYAEHGYAVLNYTARGWSNSCGTEESRKETPACEDGYIRLGDQPYEAPEADQLWFVMGQGPTSLQGLMEQNAAGDTTGMTEGGSGDGEVGEVEAGQPKAPPPTGEPKALSSRPSSTPQARGG